MPCHETGNIAKQICHESEKLHPSIRHEIRVHLLRANICHPVPSRPPRQAPASGSGRHSHQTPPARQQQPTAADSALHMSANRRGRSRYPTELLPSLFSPAIKRPSQDKPLFTSFQLLKSLHTHISCTPSKCGGVSRPRIPNPYRCAKSKVPSFLLYLIFTSNFVFTYSVHTPTSSERPSHVFSTFASVSISPT